MDTTKASSIARMWRWWLIPLLFIGAVLLLLRACPAATEPASDNKFHLTILHTNDIHSHDEEYMEKGHQIGGLPRLGHMIRTLKKRQPDALVIDAGDIFQGTPLYTKYHGEVEVSLLNAIGYDIYTIGNHEFDDGPQNLAQQLKKAKFKVINCNMDCSAEPELAAVITPYVVKEINEQKVAFVGAITPELNEVALRCGAVRIKARGANWMDPIKEQIRILKDQGINKIILVTHIGVELDKELGLAVPEIDAIIGGHSHTRLDEALVVPHADGTTTTIVQTGCFTRALGKLDLTFNDKGEVEADQTKYHLINMSDKIYQDQDLKAYVDEKVKPLLPLRNTVVGIADGEFDNYFRTTPWDSALGDLICDSLFEAGKNYGAQIAFENRGGIRGRIDPGQITLEKVEELLPFDNHTVFATVTGKCILDALEHSLSAGLGGPFLDQHGLKIAYDTQKPKGERLIFALVQDQSAAWVPLDLSGRYRIVINDYSFDGGEGYDFKCAENVTRAADKLSIAFRTYIKNHSQVAPGMPSRIAPVTPGLLQVETNAAGQKVLHVRSGMGNGRLTFVAATGRGVESTPEKIPVPLADPHVFAHARCNQDGACDWQVSLEQLKAALNAKSPVQLGISLSGGNESESQAGGDGAGKSESNSAGDRDRGFHKAKEKSSDTGAIPSGSHLFVDVIIQPPKGARGKRSLISYPVALN